MDDLYEKLFPMFVTVLSVRINHEHRDCGICRMSSSTHIIHRWAGRLLQCVMPFEGSTLNRNAKFLRECNCGCSQSSFRSSTKY